jgi:hypothetical protein
MRQGTEVDSRVAIRRKSKKNGGCGRAMPVGGRVQEVAEKVFAEEVDFSLAVTGATP